MTNLNAAGQTYEADVSAGPWDLEIYLSTGAKQHIADTRSEAVARVHFDQDDKLAFNVLRALGRLNGILHHYNNYVRCANEVALAPKYDLTGKPTGHTPPIAAMVNHHILDVELESLVLHATAALDTVATLSKEHIVGFKVGDRKKAEAYFSNLKEGLANADKRDIRASLISSAIDECAEDLSTIIISDGRKAVRNIIAHRSGLASLVHNSFTIHWLENGKVLRLDQDAYGIALSARLHRMTSAALYFVSRWCSIMLAFDHQAKGVTPFSQHWRVEKDIFRPTWVSPFISWREFETQGPDGIEVTVIAADEAFIRKHNVRLRSTVLELAVEID